MSTSPTIQYSGPKISPEVPWETRRHLQLLYQKLGNHTQAFSLVQNQISKLNTGSTTTNITEVAGGGSVTPSSGFMGQGYINDQSGNTAYATVPADNGILLILSDSSAVAVTLTTTAAPFYLIIANFGTGTVTLSPSAGTITYPGTSGASSMPLQFGQAAYVACDSINWDAATLTAASSINFADNEIPSGTIDGTNVTFTLVNAPIPASSLHLHRNGLRMSPGTDYTISADTITFANPPSPGDILDADYRF